MSVITEFIPKLQELNVIYDYFIVHGQLKYESHCAITAFYNEYKDVKLFEKMVLNIVLNMDQHTGNLLLRSMLCEVERNIDLYEYDKYDFDRVEADCVSDFKHMMYDNQVEQQIVLTSTLGLELMQVIEGLDQLIYTGDLEVGNALWASYDVLMKKHRLEVETLHVLYQKRKECMEEAEKHARNLFEEMGNLCDIFQSILYKYLPQEQVTVSVASSSPSGNYFDMGLVSAIYRECNDVQFESMDEMGLYAVLNNHATAALLKIKSGEKVRMYYLIHKLYECVKTNEKAFWRAYILDLLCIKEKIYLSKYKEPTYALSNAESKDFVVRMDRIFKM